VRDVADQRRNHGAFVLPRVESQAGFVELPRERLKSVARNGLAPDHDVRIAGVSALLAEEFLEHFERFLHRLQRLTQLTLALDGD